ncbi:hypothetical protein U1Q18_031371 [Sarracenia purpurea var. burkii]
MFPVPETVNPTSTHPTLHALRRCKTLDALKQLHSQMITTGIILHTYPLSRILLLSATVAPISYTLSIFNHFPNPTIFLFNTLISSLGTHHTDAAHIAFSLYARILNPTTLLKPNCFTYPSLFKACASHSWLNQGRALHSHVLKFLEPPYDRFVQASLLNFYSKFGKLGVCRYLFDQIVEPDLAAWNSILSAYARNDGFSLEVLSMFSDMQKSLVRPNEVTLVGLISACADLSALSQGAWAHVYVLKNNLKLNRFLGTVLIKMYANCGLLNMADQVFDKLPERDTFCYNAMIRGLAIHGYGHQALDLFERMRIGGLVPDDVTILVTMCGCSHVGLVEEGCKIFDSMKELHGHFTDRDLIDWLLSLACLLRLVLGLHDIMLVHNLSILNHTLFVLPNCKMA